MDAESPALAVAVSVRGQGVGTRLVRRAERAAAAAGLAELVLLTETAEDFFAQLGYLVVARREMPAGIRASAEFRAPCPASAVCMRKVLP